MKQIILMRHGMSIGNERKIIQGQLDYGLSKTGIEKLSNEKFTELKNITNIYSSDLSRAYQSAEIVRDIIQHQKPILICESLRENGAGILEGKTKEYCSRELPEYYQTYLKRGDYDSILEAEKWIENQARVLIILSQYIDKTDFNDLMVSHAAFIRTFVNMVKLRDRNTQFNIPNGSIHFLPDPLRKLNIEKYSIAKSSVVHKIGCYDNDYIIKQKEEQLSSKDYFEYDLLKYLSQYMKIPQIIKMANTSQGQTKVLQYFNGIHKFGNLNEKDTKTLLETVGILNKHLQNYEHQNIEDGSIINDLNYIISRLYSEDALIEAKNLLSDSSFRNYLNDCKKCLVHNDLHRSNILINNDEVYLLDFENIKRYPSDLQLATLLCSSFLLEDPNCNIDSLIDEWPIKIDCVNLKKLIKYRLLYGLAFFENKIKSEDFDESDLELQKKYMRVLRREK